MPETTSHHRAPAFLRRYGCHALLLIFGAVAYLSAANSDLPLVVQPAPLESAALPDTGVAVVDPFASASSATGASYARSPLLPSTPEIEDREPVESVATSDVEPRAQGGPAPLVVEDLQPLFINYTVEEGDTVSQLAERYGVSQETILDNNNDIVDPAGLQIGERLTVPTRDGIIHTVQLGETLDTISEVFRAESNDIVNFQGNDLRSPGDLHDGQVILVVGGQFPEPVETVPAPDFATPGQPGDGGPLVVPDSGFLAGVPQAISDSGFILPYWPCAAPSAIQDFGYARGRLHAGVDMPSFCARASNVYAAQSGTIVLADWNGGYGQLVVIDHGFGFSTYYAHLSQVLVSRGQQVYRGQVVGVSGNTGASFGEHLHFEVRVGGQPTDPKPYLPWPWPTEN
ncbi:MAG: peptidoglycan DD-metalloendopeptidase family protein [Dehalococcoidia bacterium]|nr:peptidoglycan DD-metalloendopeptidase family protein [Dehalococcoidia bacterium]